MALLSGFQVPSESLLTRLMLHQFSFIIVNGVAPRGLAKLGKRQLSVCLILPCVCVLAADFSVSLGAEQKGAQSDGHILGEELGSL